MSRCLMIDPNAPIGFSSSGFNTPLVEPGTWQMANYWERKFSRVTFDLLSYLFGQLFNRALTTNIASRPITTTDFSTILVCTGGQTFTLPAISQIGDTYYFFNGDGLTTTIAGSAGTINGVATYSLTAQYQFVQVSSLDGMNWIVTAKN